MKTTRREFLKLGVGIGITLALPGVPVKAEPTPDPLGEWLECDGSVISRYELPELCDVLGTTYNASEKELAVCRLPDLRARYVAAGRMGILGQSGGVPATMVDGKTGQPTTTAVRYLIKAKPGPGGDDVWSTTAPFNEIPIGTIIASL